MFKRSLTGGIFVWLLMSGIVLLATSKSAMAHDPIFGLGPHTIYEGGVEITPEFNTSQAGNTRSQNITLLKTAYGINADWTVGRAFSHRFRLG